MTHWMNRRRRCTNQQCRKTYEKELEKCPFCGFVPRTQGDLLLNSATKFLRSKGWKPIVIGGISIEQQQGFPRFNYQLVIKFTGGKEDGTDPRPAATDTQQV